MDVESIDRRDWATAQRRAEILSTLPERPSGEQIRDAMAVLGVGRTTLFRWLKRFREGARTSALAPRRRGPHSGMRPLAPDVLTIVEKHFRDFYATRRRPTLTRFWAEIAADCRREGLAGPSIRRLRRWLDRHDEAELPRLSLDARRANHAFLTLPIARQALLVAAPEYNRFAPVLAKPVRPGLGALARGSLLQNYALAVGVARLTENPVAHAAVALAAADAEGETSLRRVLRSWPWATRRRIDTHLRRLLAANSAAKITAGQPNRGRIATQSHKLCSSPTNFGSFCPTNCESESRNYARPGRSEPWIP